MSYKFKKSRKPKDEIPRVVDERIRHAIHALSRYPEKDVKGLHTARKDIKKVRSLLQLLRAPGLRDLRKSLNAEMRKTAARLSPHRDREVLARLMEKWLELPEVSRDPSLRSTVSALSEFYSSQGTMHPPLDPSIVQRSGDSLIQLAHAIGKADLSPVSWKSIERSARKCIGRMQKARDAYSENPGTETLHAWRKQVKNHYFNLLLLKEIDPPEKGRIQSIKRLEKRLGKARDLDLLLTSLREAKSLSIDIREMGSLLAFTEHRKAGILKPYGSTDP